VNVALPTPNLRVGRPARGVHLAAEEDGVDELVLPVAALEDAVPELLHAVDDRHDAAILPLVRILSRLARLIDVARRIAPADLLVVEWTELTEPATVGEQRDHQVDDETDQCEPAATDGDPARADAATTGVRDLAGSRGRYVESAPRDVLPARALIALLRSPRRGSRSV